MCTFPSTHDYIMKSPSFLNKSCWGGDMCHFLPFPELVITRVYYSLLWARRKSLAPEISPTRYFSYFPCRGVCRWESGGRETYGLCEGESNYVLKYGAIDINLCWPGRHACTYNLVRNNLQSPTQNTEAILTFISLDSSREYVGLVAANIHSPPPPKKQL